MISIILMFLGEFLIIYAENYAAKYGGVRNLQQRIFLSGLIIVSGFSLLYAYKTGYQQFDNIRVVVAISIGSILLVEPIVSRYMFQELPTKGAILGCLLGIVGILLATVWK